MTFNSANEVLVVREKIGLQERFQSWISSLRLRNSGGQSSVVLDQLITPPAELMPEPVIAIEALGEVKSATSVDAVEAESLNEQPLSEKGEVEKQLDKLSSIKCFPPKTQEVVRSYLHIHQQLHAEVKDFYTKLFTNLTHIQELVASVKKEPENDGSGSPNYFTSERMEFSQYTTELLELQKTIKANRVPHDMECDETIDATSPVAAIFNQCAELLLSAARFSSQSGERKAQLRRRIKAENIQINDEYMSHVTSYDALVDIIRNGHLMSKARQLQVNGRSRITVVSKPDQEMHQLVFDRRKIRPEYSSPEGTQPTPPVIFLAHSATILSNYQGMESDGWHAFGKNHDTSSRLTDDFDEDLTQKRFAILVPEEYQEKLYQDLQHVYPDRSQIDQRLKELNIVFMDSSLYRKPDGSLYGYSDMQQNHGLVTAIYERAKKELPPKSNAQGRLIENGNIGHGSETFNKSLSSFVLAD